jgi:hypothetical protein
MEIFLFFDKLKGNAIEERVSKIALNDKASLPDKSMLEQGRNISRIELTYLRVEPTLEIGNI